MSSSELSRQDAAAGKWLRQCEKAFRSEKQVTFAVDHLRSSVMAAAWMIRILRTASSVVRLHRAGLADTASPLVRSVIEHTVSMIWLTDRREEAVKAIEYHHRLHQRKLRTSAQQSGWDVSAFDSEGETHPMDEAMIPPEDAKRMEIIEQRLPRKRFEHWYTAYRLETALSHATYLSGAVYVPLEEPGFVWRGVIKPTPLRGTALYVLLAGQAYAELVQPSPEFRSVLGEGERLFDLTVENTGQAEA